MINIQKILEQYTDNFQSCISTDEMERILFNILRSTFMLSDEHLRKIHWNTFDQEIRFDFNNQNYTLDEITAEKTTRESGDKIFSLIINSEERKFFNDWKTNLSMLNDWMRIIFNESILSFSLGSNDIDVEIKQYLYWKYTNGKMEKTPY